MEKKQEPRYVHDAGEHADIKPSDYLRAVRAQLRGGKQKEAYKLLLQATVQYPEDPLILSYFGCLQAVVDKKFRSGTEACKRAILLLKKQQTFSEEVLYPVFCLNLGRAYVAADKKKDAIDAFKKGLKYDGGNNDLRQEMLSLGVRKQPPLSFLSRSNPINKIIGKILHKTKKSSGAKTGARGR